jgi:hypothetical protein
MNHIPIHRTDAPVACTPTTARSSRASNSSSRCTPTSSALSAARPNHAPPCPVSPRSKGVECVEHALLAIASSDLPIEPSRTPERPFFADSRGHSWKPRPRRAQRAGMSMIPDAARGTRLFVGIGCVARACLHRRRARERPRRSSESDHVLIGDDDRRSTGARSGPLVVRRPEAALPHIAEKAGPYARSSGSVRTSCANCAARSPSRRNRRCHRSEG